MKKFLIGLAFLLALLIVGLRLWQAEWKPEGKTDLRFKQAELPFTHILDKNSLPFAGAAAFDLTGDGIDELFLGGGKQQPDNIFQFQDGKFVKLPIDIQKDPHDATYGSAHLDVDNDGDVDLFTARESGVWLHINDGKLHFNSRKLSVKMADNTVPLSIALGDIDKDGWVDLYISGYIKNELVEGTTIFVKPYGGYSQLLLNDGRNHWTDATKQAGLHRQHNTFTAVFADLDNDHDSDLVIAQDTGVIEMYENTGSFPMKPIPNPTVNSYPMGLAVGDYNNDGLVDIYASNVGHTLPRFLLKGDLPKDAPFNTDYMLLHNDGNLKFTDVAREAGVGRLGFGWGTVFADMDMDGNLDLLASQNYAKMPLSFLMAKYCGKLLLNNGKGGFAPVEKTAGAEAKGFGVTPIVADFNNDGWPDIVWVNVKGKAQAFISEGNGKKGSVIRLPDTTENLGVIIKTIYHDGKIIKRQVIAGQGLGADQTRTIFLPGTETDIRANIIEPQNIVTNELQVKIK